MQDLAVLVVDDEPELAELVAMEYEAIGSKVYTADNCRNAIRVAKEHSIDILITDYRMPNESGLDLAIGLTKENILIPVLIFMTGFADLTLEDAYNCGAGAIFGKPFNKRELIKTSGRLLLPYEERWQGVNEEPATRAISLVRSFPEIDGSSLKLGRGGFFCPLKEEFPTLSDAISFEISFDGGPVKSIKGLGVVRWVRSVDESDEFSSGIGVEIIQIDSKEERESLANYLNQQRPVAFIPKG